MAHSLREPQRRYPLVNGLFQVFFSFFFYPRAETGFWTEKASRGLVVRFHRTASLRDRDALQGSLHGDEHEQEHELRPPAWWLAVGLHMYAPASNRQRNEIVGG